MKKVMTLGLFVLSGMLSQVRAQSSSTPVTVETVTALPPADETPLKFTSLEALNNYVPVRIAEVKLLIVEHQHNPAKAIGYREELWRLEHAIVEVK